MPRTQIPGDSMGPARGRRVLLVDNFDSFTWNLVQAFSRLGAEVWVHRNDALTIKAALAMPVSHLVLSPGPGHPRDAGITPGLAAAALGHLPLLGVCLGHQALVEALGGVVKATGRPVHGKASVIHHDEQGLFAGVPQDCPMGRYHSLAADPGRMPECLRVTGWSRDGMVMAVAHRTELAFGVQFHPESVLSPDGPRLLANFLALDRASKPQQESV
jgi:anthranilate synthase/aminodeoxychorismate synthase-like glutamine amidotransferase